MAVTLAVCDAARDPVLNVDWVQVQCDVKFREVGAGSFTADATTELVEALATPGSRIRLMRDEQVFSSGPVEMPLDIDETAEGPSLLTCQWGGELAAIWGEQIYPDPSIAITTGTTFPVEAWTRTAVAAEVVMRDAVNLNVGPGAVAARQVPGLVLGPLLGVGTVIDAEERMTKLGDALKKWAITGGGLGFALDEVEGGLVFRVWQPADRSANIRFSFALNNLDSLKYRHEAPKGTVVIVGSNDSGTARTYTATTNANNIAWGRREVFSNGEDATAALAENAETITVTAVATDSPKRRFGRDFFAGDLVAVETRFGQQIVDTVVAAHLTADEKAPDGIVTVSIGSGHANSGDPVIDHLRRIERRVDKTERF